MSLPRSFLVLTLFGLVAALGCSDREGGGGTDAGPRRPDGGGGGGAENTPALCSDNMDNDGDGDVDCNDVGCCGRVSCGMETVCGRRDGGVCEPTPGQEMAETTCGDMVDNDCDGRVDCRDFDCESTCGNENSNPACSDGMDNDNDGFIDCDDIGCQERYVCGCEANDAFCSDGMDNDMDGMADCMDPDCQGEGIVVCDGTTAVDVPEAMRPAALMARCTNGTSDDGNAFVDCGDFACSRVYAACGGPVFENSNAACSDMMDNDLDGLTDCMDPNCNGESVAVCGAMPPTPDQYQAVANARCSNAMSDDGNRFVDCDDFSCSLNPEVTVCENNDGLCNDSTDNDMNGFTDCMDFGCTRTPRVTVCGTLEATYEACTNNLDDDGDGRVDCSDFDCQNSLYARPACQDNSRCLPDDS